MNLLEYCITERDDYIASLDRMENGNEWHGKNGFDVTAQEIVLAKRIVAELNIEIARHA